MAALDMQIYANDVTEMLPGSQRKAVNIRHWAAGLWQQVIISPSCGKHPQTSLKSCWMWVSLRATGDRRMEQQLNFKRAVLFDLR